MICYEALPTGLSGAPTRALAGAAILLAGTLLVAPAVALTQQDIDWCANAGQAFTQDQAIDGCTAAIGSGRWSEKDLVWAFVDRGLAHEIKGETDAAIADYDRAIQLDPASVNAFYDRGLAYNVKGDYGRAIADFDRVIQLDPTTLRLSAIAAMPTMARGKATLRSRTTSARSSLIPHPSTRSTIEV